jgi:hypothetical protein
MKISPLFNLLILVSLSGYSQINDTVTAAKGTRRYINDKFPTTRAFDLQYEQLGAVNYDARFLGDVERGRIENHSKLKFASNIKLYTSESKRFFITNSFRYKYESYELGNNNNAISDSDFEKQKREFHYFSNAVSATYFTSLFRKPVLYNATVTGDANDKAFQRVKGFVSATMIMKNTESTTITIGAIAFADPSSIVPFVPVFSYEHQFMNSSWQLDIILPQRIMVKRGLLENGRISLGTEINNENFYINFNDDRLKGVYELNQLELKSGITYEYEFFKNFIGTFKGGFNNVVNSRITLRGEKTSKYVIENKQGTQIYFNLGFSYNPF